MIVIHVVVAFGWYSLDVRSFEWHVLNFYDALVAFAVPIFVMISGALFLNPDKDIPIRKLYSKYILKIVTAFVFWSFVFSARAYVKDNDIVAALEGFIQGAFHMWFLYMIVGLYMIVPFVSKIAASESLTKYFLVLALIFTSLLPECADIISVFSEKYGKFAYARINTLNMSFVAGFTGYFLLGHFLDRIDISPKYERMIYAAGIFGASMTILMSAAYVSMYQNKPCEVFYGRLKLNVLCESIALFVFCKQHINCESSIIRKLSQYSFGAYLIHTKMIALVLKISFETLALSSLFKVPVIAVIVFLLSFVISAALNHIPVLNKYIV